MSGLAKIAVSMAAAYAWHRLTAGAGNGCPLMCSPWRALAVGALLGMLWAGSAASPARRVGQLSELLGTAPEGKTNVSTTIETGTPVHLSEDEFVALLGSADKPILLDAYAEWCGPCRLLGPELEQAAARLGERAVVVKIDVDQCPRISHALAIRSVPALFLLHGDLVVATWTGFAPADTIVARVEPLLAAAPKS